MRRFLAGLDVTVIVVEVLVAFALVILSVGMLVSLALEMLTVANTGFPISHDEFNTLINGILGIFILVELFRIAIAYLKHENVIPTVLEAALVAIARKFVVYEGGDNFLQTAVGMSALLVAVALSSLLLAKARDAIAGT